MAQHQIGPLAQPFIFTSMMSTHWLQQAVSAGVKLTVEPADQFHGERSPQSHRPLWPRMVSGLKNRGRFAGGYATAILGDV